MRRENPPHHDEAAEEALHLNQASGAGGAVRPRAKLSQAVKSKAVVGPARGCVGAVGASGSESEEEEGASPARRKRQRTAPLAAPARAEAQRPAAEGPESAGEEGRAAGGERGDGQSRAGDGGATPGRARGAQHARTEAGAGGKPGGWTGRSGAEDARAEPGGCVEPAERKSVNRGSGSKGSRRGAGAGARAGAVCGRVMWAEELRSERSLLSAGGLELEVARARLEDLSGPIEAPSRAAAARRAGGNPSLAALSLAVRPPRPPDVWRRWRIRPRVASIWRTCPMSSASLSCYLQACFLQGAGGPFTDTGHERRWARRSRGPRGRSSCPRGQEAGRKRPPWPSTAAARAAATAARLQRSALPAAPHRPSASRPPRAARRALTPCAPQQRHEATVLANGARRAEALGPAVSRLTALTMLDLSGNAVGGAAPAWAAALAPLEQLRCLGSFPSTF